MTKLLMQDLSVANQSVLMRVDFNVPLSKEGTITDLTRIQASLPSIEWVLKQGGRLILMSHLGRPKGFDPRLSLKPCAEALSILLNRPVLMAADCIGREVASQARSLKNGEILLLENLRFHSAEEDPSLDPSFAAELASLAHFYVNEAFGSDHRKHASIWDVPALFPNRAAAGFLLQKEIHFLGTELLTPQRPFYVLIGGAKVSTKINVLKTLAPKTDGLFIGGAMAFTFYKALGIPVGKSLIEEDLISVAAQFIQTCRQYNIPFWLPVDSIITKEPSEEAYSIINTVSEGIPDGWEGVDIGPQTCLDWKKQLQNAKTIFWNGPLGIFEIRQFAKGTNEIAQIIGSLNATKIIGGGDSVAAIHQLGLQSSFTHLSTGGGAALEYVELTHLPGIDALSDKP